MIYKEEKRDLFSVEEDYWLAHCIASDFGLGAGIAVQFNTHFNMKNKLKLKYKNVWEQKGYCIDILNDKVFNLITKEKSWGKPSLQTITDSLIDMKNISIKLGINKIAMPKIGCGLDGLDWDSVKNIINYVFKDTDIEILVCYI